MACIEIEASRIACQDQGRGQPVVLLHSTGASGRQWRVLSDRLAASHRVLVPDLYGYGESAPWPGGREFSLADEAAIVHALLERVGEPVHLVGHSYGGAVALHVARERGEALRSLTLIEPVAFHLLREGDEADLAALREIADVAAMVGRALASGDNVAGFGRFVDYWSGPGAWAAIAMDKRVTLAASVAKVALDFHATLHNRLLPDDFGNFDVPTLLLHGSATKRPPQRICRRLARALRNVSTRIIDGAGHMLPLTHRDEVNALIVAHLNANARASHPAGVAQFA